MRPFLLFFGLLAFCAGAPFRAQADPRDFVSKDLGTDPRVNPSKDKRPDLFSGDPERIKRANEIKRDDFEVEPVLDNLPVVIPQNPDDQLPTFRAGMLVRNVSKRPKTLSFPDAKRVDVVFTSVATGAEVYRWSSNKEFMQLAGTSMIMPKERGCFMVDIPLARWAERPAPGQYKLYIELANYTNFVASTNITFVTQTRSEANLVGPMPQGNRPSPNTPAPDMPQ